MLHAMLNLKMSILGLQNLKDKPMLLNLVYRELQALDIIAHVPQDGLAVPAPLLRLLLRSALSGLQATVEL